MTVKIYSEGSAASIEFTESCDANGDICLNVFVEDGMLGGEYVSVEVSHGDLIELVNHLNRIIKG